MNLVVEYVVRTGLAQQSLETPCSLFLTGDQADKRIVVTIHDDASAYLVRRWSIADCDCRSPVPPCSHVRINSREQLFSSPAVIMPGYCLMPFHANQSRLVPQQGEDSEMQQRQQKIYREEMASLLNPKVHIAKRKRWLWHAFLNVYLRDLPQDEVNLMFHYFNAMSGAFALDKFGHKELMPIWSKWVFELDPPPTRVATELVFKSAFKYRQKAAA